MKIFPYVKLPHQIKDFIYREINGHSLPVFVSIDSVENYKYHRERIINHCNFSIFFDLRIVPANREDSFGKYYKIWWGSWKYKDDEESELNFQKTTRNNGRIVDHDSSIHSLPKKCAFLSGRVNKINGYHLVDIEVLFHPSIFPKLKGYDSAPLKLSERQRKILFICDAIPQRLQQFQALNRINASSEEISTLITVGALKNEKSLKITNAAHLARVPGMQDQW